MNLWFRLIWLVATAWFRSPLVIPQDVSSLRFRVLPSDLDTSAHMNNGRYWTLMDLGRADLMLRTGIWRSIMANRWVPIVSAGNIRFRRELRCFAAFELQTAVVHWDGTRFVIQHRFVDPHTGIIAATALVLAGIYDRRRRGFVPPAELLGLTDDQIVELDTPEEVHAFLNAEEQLRRSTA